MSDVLQVEDRKLVGKLHNRRLRGSGKLPAVLYGHGKETLSLSVPEDQLNATLRHGAQVVQLQGAASGQALLQEVQWDTFQQYVLHVDLMRVDETDRVQVEVPLVLRGEAPGTHSGGIVEQLMRSIEMETSPSAIPENLHLNINSLQLGDSLTVNDIEDLPEGAKLLVDTSKTIVQCVEPVALPDEEEGAVEGSIEPEVIGQKSEEDSAGDEKKAN